MAGLAPNKTRSRSFRRKNTAIITQDMAQSITKQLARILLAATGFPCPMRMLIRGAPPTPTQLAKEEIRVTMGPQTPAPARAASPISGIFPMYIRSTML